MVEVLIGFFIFAVVMTFVTLLGHGLWLIAAAILRTLLGMDQAPTVAGLRCPECGHTTSLVQGTCRDCGYQTLARRRAELDGLIRLIRRLHGSGKIADGDFEGVMSALATEFQRLRPPSGLEPRYLSPPAPAAPPPSVATSPAISPLDTHDGDSKREASDRPAVSHGEVLDAEVFEILDDEPVPPAVSPFQSVPHPLDAPDPEPTSAPAAAATFSPRRTMADMLQSFMEEKNIRWGELASGMLIVGSAVGLVISLRAELRHLSRQIPYFPALLLMLGTVAIHAAGLYTLRRWKLRSTSRGVLIIATLLVPLSFAAGIMLSGTGDDRVAVGSPFYLAAVFVGLVGYGVVTSFSARALFPEGWWRLTVAVMGASAGQLVINRLAGQPSSTELLVATGLFALPLASYLIATLFQLRAMSVKQHLTPVRAAQTFTVLGIASFSLAVPLCLQAGISEAVRATVAALSPSLSVAAAVVLSIGIAVQRRCQSKRMGETRTVGTALALLGGMMMLGTVFAAWPDPTVLIAVATVTAVTLMVLAVVGQLPVLHAGAVAAASFAVLLLYHHAAGQFEVEDGSRGRDVIRAILMGRSAIVLLVPTLLSAIAGMLLVKQQRRREGLTYLASAAGIATSSLLIAFYAGFWSGTDANWTTPIFILYAACTLALVPVLKRQEITWAGSAALLVALIHLFCFRTWLEDRFEDPLLLATLIHALVTAAYGLALQAARLQKHTDPGDLVGMPARLWLHPLPLSGALTAALTIPFVLYVPASAFGTHGAYAACVTVIWAIAAGVLRDPRVATAAQTAVIVAIGYVTAAVALRQEWPDGLQDLRHWQLQLSVLGIWCLLATAVRLTTRRWAPVHEVFKPPWPSVDQLLLGVLVAAVVFVGATGCWTFAWVELGSVSATSAAAQDSWHVVAHGSGSWIALACIVAGVLLLLYEQVTVTRLGGLVISTAVVPLLLSGSFENSLAVASALRWTFAIYTFTWIAAITFRAPLQKQMGRAFPSARTLEPRVAHSARDLATLLGVVPVAFLTTAAVVQVSEGVTFNGPAAESFFGRMSETMLYATPLALLVVGIVVIAVRDGSTRFALLGSLLLQYFVALAVLLPTLSQGNAWSNAVSVSLAQWTACSLAAYALLWRGLSQWIDRHTTRSENWPFQLQLVAAGTASLGLAAWALGPIFLDPSRIHSVVNERGLWPSYVAAALATLAAASYFRADKSNLAVLGVVVPCIFAVLAAATSATGAAPGSWLAYHVLTISFLAVALVAAAVCAWRRHESGEPEWLRYLTRSATVVAVSVFVLLARGCVDDPIAAGWTIGVATGLVVFIAAQGVPARRQAYAYASAAVAVFATSVAWCHLSNANDEEFLAGFISANVLLAGVVAIFWLSIDIWYQRERGESWAPRFPLIPIQTLVAIGGTAIMALVGVGGTAISIMAGLAGSRNGLTIADAWGLAALLTLGMLLIGMLWEQRAGLGLVASYVWGFVAIGLLLNLLQQTEAFGPRRIGASWLVVGAGLAGAAYVALTGHGWKWGANIAKLAVRLRVPSPVEKLRYISRWLPAFNLVATSAICALGFVTIFTASDRTMRVTVAFAPLLLAYGVSCLAQQQRKFAMQCLALFLVVVGGIFIGWADVTAPRGDAGMLAYAARLLVVLAGMTLLYSLGVARWIGERNSWFDAVRRSGVILAATTTVVLTGVLVLEVALFKTGVGAPIATPEVVAISVMLFGFVVALLTMAVLPGRDPLALTEKGRQGYVYAAQATAALLFAHIYLAKPKLFELGLMEYWPYIVMCIAFASVAFAEFCFRKDWRVIAEPMERTGGFLPLLPVLTAWTFASASSYPLTLFFAGLIYVFMSVSRRSFIAGIAAAVMGNGALWALFVEQGLQLTTQPQLWMIPPALSVLGASYINRDRLSNNTLTAIRYICVMIIYLSSTGEMFMKLLPRDAHDWVRPLILTSLSVGGIFAGILLRVRAFLYLGSSFLLLSMVAMVWNAQRLVGHTWPWWVFGISMGLAILVIFGLFEKHRQDVQRLVSRLRQWEP